MKNRCSFLRKNGNLNSKTLFHKTLRALSATSLCLEGTTRPIGESTVGSPISTRRQINE